MQSKNDMSPQRAAEVLLCFTIDNETHLSDIDLQAMKILIKVGKDYGIIKRPNGKEGD